MTDGNRGQIGGSSANPPIDLDSPTPLNILHRLVYNLVYPAILGTYLYTILFPATKIDALVSWWMLIVVVYLAAQYTLGTFRYRRYTPASFIVDVMEIGLMAFVLSRMAAMSDTDTPSPNIQHALMALLIIPVIYRALRFAKGSITMNEWGFHGSLTLLSIVAAVAAGLGFPGHSALVVFAACITVYLLAFVIFNSMLFQNCPQWRRPTQDHID